MAELSDQLGNQLSFLKACTCCGQSLPLDAFYKDKRAADGLTSRCKQCAKEADEARRQADPEQNRRRNAAWRQRNKEHVKDKKKEWAEANPEYSRDYLQETDYSRHWRASHPGYAAESTQHSRAGPAAPRWLTKEHRDRMRRYYAQAALLRELTGDDSWQVDHIAPLQETVAEPTYMGLHVPWNLEIVTRDWNVRKSNTLIRDILERSFI